MDVQQALFKMPVNGWARDPTLKELGYLWGANVFEGLAGFSYQLFNRAFDRTSDEIEVSRQPGDTTLTPPRRVIGRCLLTRSFLGVAH